jgi:hypothetical protein
MKRPLPLVILAVLSLTGCAVVPHFEYGDVYYRMKGSQEATLGAIGVKRTFPAAEFESKMSPDLTGVPIRLAVKYSQSSNSNFEVQANAAAKYAAAGGQVDAGVVKQNLRSGNFQIFKLGEVNKLVRRLNSDPEALQWLKNKKARIITAVVVVFDDTEHNVRNINAGGSASVSAKIIGADSDPKVSVTLKSGRTTDLKLSDGTITGYEMSAPVFGADGKLIDLTIDKVGLRG